MNRSALVVWLLAPSLLAGCAGRAPSSVRGPGAEPDGKPELVGVLTREQIELAVPDWVEEEMAAVADPAATGELLNAVAGAEVSVFLGTWCSDSRRELARLWRAFDDVGAEAPVEIRYIGVDREKSEPRELVAGRDVRFVPTFIVHRQGREVGRIVEQSPAGIEVDLLALLRGERQGLVTAREDLLGEPNRPRR